MAVQGQDGLLYSFDSDDLIKEAVQDYQEFGNIEVYVWVKKVAGIKLYVNYDFPEPEMPLDYDKQVKPDEEIEVINLHDLIVLLKEQNSII